MDNNLSSTVLRIQELEEKEENLNTILKAIKNANGTFNEAGELLFERVWHTECYDAALKMLDPDRTALRDFTIQVWHRVYSHGVVVAEIPEGFPEHALRETFTVKAVSEVRACEKAFALASGENDEWLNKFRDTLAGDLMLIIDPKTNTQVAVYQVLVFGMKKMK
jgi:hypothetical protein